MLNYIQFHNLNLITHTSDSGSHFCDELLIEFVILTNLTENCWLQGGHTKLNAGSCKLPEVVCMRA